MAARSFFITAQNWTGTDFQLVNKHLDHGEWSDSGNDTPPENLPKVHLDEEGDAAAGQIWFESESDGFATGTEGNCLYKSSKGDMTINWDNPFVGNNSFSASGPKGFRLSWGTISGNNANVIVEITH